MAPAKGIRPLGMQRNNAEIPAPNRILEQRELEKLKRHHEERLHHVKSTSQTNARKQLDNSVPVTSTLLLADHKKLLRETNRLATIEHENSQLLAKLSTIAKSGARLAPDGSIRPGTAFGFAGTGTKCSGNGERWPAAGEKARPARPGTALGFAGTGMTHSGSGTRWPPACEKGRPASALDGGLNQKGKKMEQEHIARENEVLLHRLLNAQGKYRRKDWEDHDRLHRLRMSQVSRFGSPGRHPGRPHRQPPPKNASRSGSPTPYYSCIGQEHNMQAPSRPMSPEPRPASPPSERMLAPLRATTRPASPDLGRPKLPEKLPRVPRLDLTAAIAYQEAGSSGGNSESKVENDYEAPPKATTSSYGQKEAGGPKPRAQSAMPSRKPSGGNDYRSSLYDSYSDTESDQESEYSTGTTEKSSSMSRQGKPLPQPRPRPRPPSRKVVQLAKLERTWVT